MTLRTLLLTLFAFSASGVAAFCQTSTTTPSATNGPRSVTLAPMGLAVSDTAQINVLNTASDSSTGTAASCTGTIAFVDTSGQAIGTASSFTVTSGQTFSAKLAGGSSRQVIHAVVTATLGSDTPCQLYVAMETYDTSTGVTHVFLDGGTISSQQSGSPGSGQSGGPTPPGQ